MRALLRRCAPAVGRGGLEGGVVLVLVLALVLIVGVNRVCCIGGVEAASRLGACSCMHGLERISAGGGKER